METFVALFGATVALVLTATLFVLVGRDDRRISRLEHTVACLRHPTHGASSMAVGFKNGKYVVIQPPVTSVC